MMMDNVLVTGGSGFIGTNVVKRLAEDNVRVRATYFSSEPRFEHPNVTYVKADLRSPNDCCRVTDSMDAMIICAANTQGAAVIHRSPLKHVTPNMVMNSYMLEAAYEAHMKKVLFISSGAAYPEIGNRPAREEDMFNAEPPDVYFAVSSMKRAIEMLCRTYAEKIDNPMPTLVVRPSNVYGPYDKFDFETSHVTAAMVRRVAERHNPIRVWGTGNDVRDIIYIDDFIEGLMLAFHADDQFLTLNISAGNCVTVREILETAIRVDSFSDAEVAYNPAKPTTIPFRLIDNSMARHRFGFAPKVSLEEGLARTLEWYRANHFLDNFPEN